MRKRDRERSRARERNSMHWIRRSVGCRVASASPRLATRHSSPDVTAARFIASVNLRRLTSRQVSGYLPIYLPTYLSTYLPIYWSRRTSMQARVATRRALPFCLPLYFPASELHAIATKMVKSVGVTRYFITAYSDYSSFSVQTCLRI